MLQAMEASANEQREKVMADVNRLQDREEKLRRIKDMQARTLLYIGSCEEIFVEACMD